MTISDIANAIGNGILDIVSVFFQTLAMTIFSPLEALWVEVDIAVQTTPLITNFYSMINTYVVPFVSWFTNLIPPLTWSAIKLHIDFMIIIYSVVFTLHVILKPLKIIKKLPLA